MALMAVVLAFGSVNAPAAQAKPTDVIVISGAVLEGTLGAAIDVSDGINATEIDSIDELSGDNDGDIEPSDLEDIDLDANQLNEHSNALVEGTFVFVFVDDDDAVVLDPKELDSSQNGVDVDDGDIECSTVGDIVDEDCDNDTTQGDDLIIFDLQACDNLVVCDSAAQAESGDDVNVEATQNAIIETATVAVVGDPDEIEIVEVEEVLSVEDGGDDCNDAEWDDDDVGDELDAIVLLGVVTDNDGTELTGVDVEWDVPNDEDEIAEDRKSVV